jgi:toxin CcdB
MMQFEGFRNPISAARRAYPYLLVLQADWISEVQERIVAPVVPRESTQVATVKLTPVVAIDGREYLVLVPALTAVRARDLRESIGSFASERDALLAAIDYLFFGP